MHSAFHFAHTGFFSFPGLVFGFGPSQVPRLQNWASEKRQSYRGTSYLRDCTFRVRGMELPQVNFNFSFISVLAEGCKLAVIQLMLFFFFKKKAFF